MRLIILFVATVIGTCAGLLWWVVRDTPRPFWVDQGAFEQHG